MHLADAFIQSDLQGAIQFFISMYLSVLIVECLFAKASTANAGAWALEAPPSSPGATTHLHLKKHTLKVAILTSYTHLSVGYSELNIYIYAYMTYFTSCKKGRNRVIFKSLQMYASTSTTSL